MRFYGIDLQSLFTHFIQLSRLMPLTFLINQIISHFKVFTKVQSCVSATKNNWDTGLVGTQILGCCPKNLGSNTPLRYSVQRATVKLAGSDHPSIVSNNSFPYNFSFLCVVLLLFFDVFNRRFLIFLSLLFSLCLCHNPCDVETMICYVKGGNQLLSQIENGKLNGTISRTIPKLKSKALIVLIDQSLSASVLVFHFAKLNQQTSILKYQ